jgi:peptidyl-prolyl cis-trans isomerase SurA
MKWWLQLSLAFALVLGGAAHAQETRIAAVVNSDIITAEDVNARMSLIMRTSGIPDTPANRQQLAPRVIRTLIDEKLELQEAAKFKVTVSKDEVANALGNIEARNNMAKGGLDDYLKSAGISPKTLTDQISTSLIWNKVVQGRYASDVSVSDAEVQDEIARIKSDFGKPQSHVAEIFLAMDNPTQDNEVKALAQKLIDQIRAGANFSAVAQQFSQAPSAAQGGDIGWVTPSQFGPPLSDAVAKMNPGEMSYPLRTPAGYYLLYLLERRTPGQSSPADTQIGFVEVVFPLAPNAPQPEQQRVAAQAQQVTNTAKSCGEMAKIARDEAPQFSTQTPSVRASDLPPELRDVLLNLKVAEASKPIPARGGIGVAMVCTRSDPTPDIPTTDQVYDQIMHERMDQMSRRYLRDLRRGAYVDIRG